MSDQKHTGRRTALTYAGVAGAAALGTIVVMLLWQNIDDRKNESRRPTFEVTRLSEDVVDPAEWGKNFPRQYDGYKKTAESGKRSRFGGNEAFQKLDADSRWRTLFDGYPFGIDYREERGHAYMLKDQEETLRVKKFKQPGACLHCHASVYGVYRKVGLENGAPAGDEHAEEQLMRGFEKVNAMPYAEANKLAKHPVACVDCHDPRTMNLRVTRPGFLNGIRALAASEDPVPHLPSVETWRAEGRKGRYEPNTMASRQEMRTFVCGQCHVEYYFKGDQKLLTYPWHKGLRAEQVEAYYDEVGHKDWTHTTTGTPALKAQHPEFEMWSQGIHARAGASCADCHMPYVREGASKISDHQVRSPLLGGAKACQVCHRNDEKELKARVETIQERTALLMDRAEQATMAAIAAIQQALAAGASDEALAEARNLHRKAEWRLDFIAAENSMGFHAPQECARILGEAIDFARQSELAAVRLGAPGVVRTAVR